MIGLLSLKCSCRNAFSLSIAGGICYSGCAIRTCRSASIDQFALPQEVGTSPGEKYFQVLRFRAAAIAGWWTLLIAIGFITLQWIIYLSVMHTRPAWFLAVWGPDVDWAFVHIVWFWAIAILKFILWLMVLVVLWLTLWARQLRKGTEHYSALVADVPDPKVPQTQMNAAFIKNMMETDLAIWTGWPGSHCLKWTALDAINYFGTGRNDLLKKSVFLSDCCAALAAVDANTAELYAKGRRGFLDEMQSRGASVCMSAEFTTE